MGKAYEILSKNELLKKPRPGRARIGNVNLVPQVHQWHMVQAQNSDSDGYVPRFASEGYMALKHCIKIANANSTTKYREVAKATVMNYW